MGRVHNNYLDILYSMGVDRLKSFPGWLDDSSINLSKSIQRRLSVLIILTFAIAWVTEIYFNRSLGGMLTGFFIPFLLADKREGK